MQNTFFTKHILKSHRLVFHRAGFDKFLTKRSDCRVKRLDSGERDCRGGWAVWWRGAWQGRGAETKVSARREVTEHSHQHLKPTTQEDWGLGC